MRWKKAGCERELYILAIILNPALRDTPFRENNPVVTPQKLWQMFKRNYERMEQRNADLELKAAFSDYLVGIGEWSDESIGLDDARELASQTVGHNFAQALII